MTDPVALAHQTMPVQVWIDVDFWIAELVSELNIIPGVRTHASCQGGRTYGPYVMVSWADESVFEGLRNNYALKTLADREKDAVASDGVAYLEEK